MNEQDDWQLCHFLLETILDAIEERRSDWKGIWLELESIVLLSNALPNKRRWGSAHASVPFSVEMHQSLDMAFMNDITRRQFRLDRIQAALYAKSTHQDTFLAMVEELREVTRALAAHKDLEADVADPIVTLRDALTRFDVSVVKAALRELLRPDQYRYQSTRTNDNQVLQSFDTFLANDDFKIWELTTAPAGCGGVAAGHPERYTWFR